MPIDPTDERLARLAARSQARRDELAHEGVRRPPPERTSRHHAARGSRGAALALSAVSTLGLAAWFHQAAAAATADAAAADTTSTAAPGAASTTATTAVGTAATSTTTGSAPSGTSGTGSSTTTTATAGGSTLTDGTFTGSSVSTKYGPVQVQITVSGGAIASVEVVEYPTQDRKSSAINARAVPTLVREALTAQSAEVDSVSGATYTSTGYVRSLQSAIDAATEAATS